MGTRGKTVIAHCAVVSIAEAPCAQVEKLLGEVGYRQLAAYAAFAADAGCPDALSDTQALVDLDRKLRPLLMQSIGIIETQFKAQYLQTMVNAYGPRCLSRPTRFRQVNELKRTLFVARNEIRCQTGQDPAAAKLAGGPRRTCAGKLAEKGPGKQHVIAPYWEKIDFAQVIESASLKTATRFFANTRDQRILQRVSRSFDTDYRSLASWLGSLASARNRCAHFQPYVIRPRIPANPKPILENGTPITENGDSPLYACLIIERLLEGRAAFLRGNAAATRDLQTFRTDAAQLLGGFAQERPVLARALRIPQAFVGVSAPAVPLLPPAPTGRHVRYACIRN